MNDRLPVFVGDAFFVMILRWMLQQYGAQRS